MATLKQRIHEFLWDLFNAGPFYECDIIPETGRLSVATEALVPGGITISETSSQFSASKNHKREYTSDRISWTWEVRIDFPSIPSISFEAFEEQLTAGPLIIPRDTGELRSVLVMLEHVEYTLPPQSSPNGGTLAVYTFLILPESLRR
jgi:hypothetical protein